MHLNMRPRLESAVYSRRTGDQSHRIHEVLAKQPDFVSLCLTPIFEFGQKNGEIRDGDPFVLATIFWAILWGELRLWYDEDYQIPFQDMQYIFTKQDH